MTVARTAAAMRERVAAATEAAELAGDVEVLLAEIAWLRSSSPTAVVLDRVRLALGLRPGDEPSIRAGSDRGRREVSLSALVDIVRQAETSEPRPVD